MNKKINNLWAVFLASAISLSWCSQEKIQDVKEKTSQILDENNPDLEYGDNFPQKSEIEKIDWECEPVLNIYWEEKNENWIKSWKIYYENWANQAVDVCPTTYTIKSNEEKLLTLNDLKKQIENPEDYYLNLFTLKDSLEEELSEIRKDNSFARPDLTEKEEIEINLNLDVHTEILNKNFKDDQDFYIFMRDHFREESLEAKEYSNYIKDIYELFLENISIEDLKIDKKLNANTTWIFTRLKESTNLYQFFNENREKTDNTVLDNLKSEDIDEKIQSILDEIEIVKIKEETVIVIKTIDIKRKPIMSLLILLIEFAAALWIATMVYFWWKKIYKLNKTKK